MKKALLFGASGHVGSHLLQRLLDDAEYSQIIAVFRQEPDIKHPKLTILKADYYTLTEIKDKLIADDVFIIIGSSDQNIELNYPILAAKLARENGALAVFIITAVGANPNAASAYLRLKGEVEKEIIKLQYNHTHVFRTSMIMGRTSDFRKMERVMMFVWRILSPLFFGPLKKYKGIEGKEIAAAMQNAAKRDSNSVNIYHWEEMKNLAAAKFTKFGANGH